MKLFRLPLALGVALLLFVGVSALAVTQTEPVNRPAPTVTIYATPSEILVGGTATLTWTSKNSTSCFGGGAWSGSKARNGSRSISPTVTSTYELSCRGRGGTRTAATTVVVRTTTQLPITATTTPPVSTSTPPTTSTTTPTTPITPPQPPTQPTTTPVTPPTQPPVVTTPTCQPFTVPACPAGNYPSPGSVDTNGCFVSMRCTPAIVAGPPQPISPPAGNAYPAGSEYSQLSQAGAYAAILYPPDQTPSGATNATLAFSVAPDNRAVWWVSGKLGLSPVVEVPVPATTTPTTPHTPSETGGGGSDGNSDVNILGATYGGSIKVTVTVTADKIDPSDKDSEVIFAGTVSPTSGALAFKSGLGTWGMRPNLKIVVTAQKMQSDSLKYGVVIDALALSSFGNRPDQGIVNNDPEWKSVDQQEKQLAALQQFPVTWIHDSIRTTGASWPQAPLLKRVQDQGKKIQLVVGQVDEDYTEGTGARVVGTNEWGGALPLSKINLALYEQRLKNNLTSYRNAGVDLRAVEVGNELDLVTFNGDIPTDRAPTDADYQLFAKSYAAFLEKTVSVVKRPEFYPNAKIILGSPAIDWSPALGKLDPAKMYAPLKNLNGKNYLALVDGIGIHYYPADHEDGAASVARTKAFLTAIGATDRPLWASEWGFYNNRFPNPAGKDRYRAFVDLYDKILRADFKVVFMTNFALDEFTFPFHLVDQSYQKLPEARFFDHYKSPVPSSVVVDDNDSSNATACINCSVIDWVDETVARIRDFILTLLGN